MSLDEWVQCRGWNRGRKIAPSYIFWVSENLFVVGKFWSRNAKKCALKTPPFWGTLKAELSLLALIISSIIREFAAI